MAVDKQIIREYGTYTELTTGGGAKELQLYMCGIATDEDNFIYRSDDGFHRCAQYSSTLTALTEGAVPFGDASGNISQDVSQFF